jgi:hypothetical protein
MAINSIVLKGYISMEEAGSSKYTEYVETIHNENILSRLTRKHSNKLPSLAMNSFALILPVTIKRAIFL